MLPATMGAEAVTVDPLTQKLLNELGAAKPTYRLSAPRFAVWERSLATHPRRRDIAAELFDESVRNLKARRSIRAKILCRLGLAALGSPSLARRALERAGLSKRAVARLVDSPIPPPRHRS